ASHECFRRLAAGEPPGCPRVQGATRSHWFTSKEYGNGARLDTGCLVLAKMGRMALRWSRPMTGTLKTVTASREADGWSVCCSCADEPLQPWPLTGRETGADVGLKVVLLTADGEGSEHPRHARTAEKALGKAQQRDSRRQPGSRRRHKARTLLAKKHQKVRHQRQDFQQK